MGLLLSPSMMCANFNNLKNEVKALNEANVDMYHMDIMDGIYVPNFGLGPEDYRTIRENTDKPMDVHMMVEDPRKYIKFFGDLGADLIYFCPDAEQQPARTIDDVHAAGMKAGIAVNTGTSFETVKELLPNIDYVLGIDGAVSRERIKQLHKRGVDNFILGTSALFGKDTSYKEIINSIRKEND